MGVSLSTHAALAPVSLASSIIGFIGFSFTIATFLNVFWESVQTLLNAGSQAHDNLNNLRIQLYEERQTLRNLRRHNKDWGHHRRRRREAPTLPRLDDTTIKTMSETLRHITRRFRALERPFLNRNTLAGRRRYYSSISPNQRNTWDAEKGFRAMERERDIDEEEDPRLQDDEYSNITFGKRVLWLRRRNEAMQLLEAVSRLQTRRIARQVGEIAVALHNYGTTIDELDEGIQDIEARLTRVIGVRRIN